MIRDIHFSFFMLTLTGVVFALYGVRVLLLGRLRNDRVEKYGGTVFLGTPVMELGYWFLDPILRVLDRWGASPNGITLFSLVPGVAAGAAAACGWFGLACLLATTAAFCDALDGLMARRRGGSSAGEALDSITDRLTESSLLVGLVVYFRASAALVAIAALALVGAGLVSYVSAKAEAMRVCAPRGAMRRAERAVLMMAGCGLTPVVAAWVDGWTPAWALVVSPAWLAVIRDAPIVLALLLIAAVANTSALMRTRALFVALVQRDGVQSPVRVPNRETVPRDKAAGPTTPRLSGDSRSASAA